MTNALNKLALKEMPVFPISIQQTQNGNDTGFFLLGEEGGVFNMIA